MESQSIRREPASEERLRESGAAGAAPGRLQLIPEYYDASAALFGNDIQWIALAKAAFADWAKQVEPVMHAEAKGWFIRDVSGRWLEFREADPLGCTAEKLQEGLLGLDQEERGNVLLQLSGERIVQVVLQDCRGNPALLLGMVMREGYPASLDNLMRLALGFPGWLYVHIEKTAGSFLRDERLVEEREARKKDILFQMALDLYSKIDTDEVLGGIIRRINELYPEARIDLLMTQDQPRSGLPVKVLNFTGMDEHVCTRAFMEGKIVIDECVHSRWPFPSAGSREFTE